MAGLGASGHCEQERFGRGRAAPEKRASHRGRDEPFYAVRASPAGDRPPKALDTATACQPDWWALLVAILTNP